MNSTTALRVSSNFALCALLAQFAGAQDVFNANANPEPDCAPAQDLGEDPAACDDPRIPEAERLHDATARLFPFVGSHTREAEFGRWLETSGYVVTTGACLGKPGHLILFLSNERICRANEISEQFASMPDDTPENPPFTGGGDVPRVRPQVPPPVNTPIPPPISPSGDVPRGRPPVIGANAGPCLPFGKGGYDFCQNPEGTRLPPGCICTREEPPYRARPVLRRPIERDPGKAPCEMPSPADLARPPDDGDIAVAILMDPDGADIGGDIAVALALPAGTTLAGGITDNDVFTAPPKPPAMQRTRTVNGWPLLPDKPVRLQGFLTKSLRIPVTTKAPQRKARVITPKQARTLQLVLTGGTGTYDPEVGKQRFLAGFLQCMNKALQDENRYRGLVDPPKRRAGPPQSCSLEVAAGQQDRSKRREIKRAFDNPLDPQTAMKNPSGTVGFISSSIDTILKSNLAIKAALPRLDKVMSIFGPVIDGADMLHSYVETLDKVAARDAHLRAALDKVNGDDPRFASRDLDPLDVGCLAGQDAADAYVYYVKTVAQLTLKAVRVTPKH